MREDLLRRQKTYLRNADKVSPMPSDDNLAAWQRRYSWVVQSALADPDERITPKEAGELARDMTTKEFREVNPDLDIPEFLQDG